MTITIKEAHEHALLAAKEAANRMPDSAYCGFAWVEVKGDLRKNIAKEFKQAGYENYTKGLLWLYNPSDSHTQSMDVKEAGAHAYVTRFNELVGEKLKAAGYLVYPRARAD